jgi:hypothetical protein
MMKCKESNSVLLEALPWNLPGETEEQHRNLREYSRFSGQDTNQPLPNTSLDRR